jgi:hypothetical protein
MNLSWSEFESEYAENFPAEKGAPAKSFGRILEWEAKN